MTHKIISINRLRIAVTFLQGTFHPKYSTVICFEVSLFDISVELSPFAVKSMFWLSSEPIRLQEITYSDLVVARTVRAGAIMVNQYCFFLSLFHTNISVITRLSLSRKNPTAKTGEADTYMIYIWVNPREVIIIPL